MRNTDIGKQKHQSNNGHKKAKQHINTNNKNNEDKHCDTNVERYKQTEQILQLAIRARRNARWNIGIIYEIYEQ